MSEADARLPAGLTGEEVSASRDHLRRALLTSKPTALDRSSLRSGA